MRHVLKFFLVLTSVCIALLTPALVFAQDCLFASLSITASKSTYVVGEQIVGNVIFTNNVAEAPVDFKVTAAKDGQVILSNSYTLQTQLGQNRWTIKDAFGTDVLPSAGNWVLSVAASYPALGCTWNADLTLTATLPNPPQIQSLDPSSAMPFTQVTIKGSNFAPTGNDIKSGSAVIAQNVPSPDGKFLAFNVPDVSPGTYPISVSNKRGTSNEVSFTVLAPPPVKLLTALTISPQDYLLGQTITGSVTVTNPTPKEIKADFSIELYKDTTLFWQRQINGVAIPPSPGPAPRVMTFPLDTVFGFKPTIPHEPSFAGNWKLVIKRTDSRQVNDLVEQTFSIIMPRLELSLTIDPKEYVLGDTLQGRGSITNSYNIPISASFKIELLQGTTPRWQREISLNIPLGTQQLTLKDIFGMTPVIPNNPSLIGNWKLKITQIGVINPVPAEAEFIIRVIEVKIESIAPSSAVAGTQVTITGTGFTPTGNNIMSGSTTLISNLPSFGGRALIFTLPNAPHGNYQLKVSNDNGVSNEVAFTVLPLKLLSSLTISAQEYFLGQTVTGSLTMNNPTNENIQASLSVEVYKDSVLFWQRQADYNIVPGINRISLDDLFGFTPIIPEDTFFVGQYKLIVRRVNINFDDSMTQTFSIKAPVLQLSFNFDPEEYFLGDALQGTGTIVNPSNTPVAASLKIELFQGAALKWQREINGISIPPGTTPFTVDDLFGFKVVIPNEVSLLGDWKLKITQLGTTPPVSAEAGFVIKSITAACKPTTGTPISGVFGMHINIWNNDPPQDLEKMRSHVKEVGAKLVRFDFAWSSIEPQKGTFDWSFYDNVVSAFHEDGIQILAIINVAPGWAGQPGCNPILRPICNPHDHLPEFANFAAELVKRYKPGGILATQKGWHDNYGITHWEIWNEPNSELMWTPAANVDEYVSMLAYANGAIRQADPDAIILHGGFVPADNNNGNIAEERFLEGMYQRGAKNCFDVLAMHPYSGTDTPRQSFERYVPKLREVAAKYGDSNKPLWFTEFGYWTGINPPPEILQLHAQYVAETYKIFKEFASTITFTTLRDFSDDYDGSLGLLRRDFSKKPAFDVLKNLLNPPKGPVSITIRGDQDIGDVKLMQGFTVGVGWNYPPEELVTKLKPKFWRVDDTWNLNVYKYARKFNPRITFILNNEFGAKPWENWQAYEKKIKDTVKASIDNNLPVDYWDVWNEPDYTLSGTPEQICEMFRRGHNAIRSVDPSAKIVGPSISGFNLPYLTLFLDCIGNNNLRFDAISWHAYGPLGTPEEMLDHTNQLRAMFSKRPALCNPKCPEIHVNEYAESKQHLIPGNNVGWFYYFEKANVDWVSRSCWWKMPYDELTSWNECGSGLDGLFIPNNFPNPGDIDGKTPEPLYWVHRAYADMAGKRIASDSSNPKVVALASKDDTTKEIRLLVGRYDQTASNVEIKIQNYPYSATVNEVQVEIKRIPSQGNVHSILTEPIIVGTKTLPVVNNAIAINTDNFQDGDAYIIIVKSQQPVTPEISINVDAAKSIGKISSHFFGAGHENNADFILPNNLRLQTIRYRAGCDVEEFYHWRDYVGPVMQQYRYGCYGNNPGGALLGPFAYPIPMRTNFSIETLDDALTYLKQKGIDIILGVNFGTGSAQEGANYVEYVNGISPGLDYGRLQGWTSTSYRGDEKAPAGYFAWLREYFGYRNPYNVKYWSIGNEWHIQTSGMSWTGNPEKYFHGGTDRPKSFVNAMLGPFRLEGKLPMTRKADRMDWTTFMKLSNGTPSQSFYGPFAPAVSGTQTIYVTEATYDPEGALQAAINTFKQYLSDRGYSQSFIDTALHYAAKYIAYNRDPDVERYLSTLTYQQQQDVIGAFSEAADAYYRTLATVGKTEIWQEVPDITKVGKGKYYQFFPQDARVLFGDGTHGDIPPKFYIITTNYDTGPHDGFLQYAQKMKAVDPNINIGVVIDSLDMEHVVIPQDVQPYVGYIAANMYFGPSSPMVTHYYGLEEGYYYLVTRAPGEGIKNARKFMQDNYGSATRWPIFNTEWSDLDLRTMNGLNIILAHSIYAADVFRTQAQNGIDISIIWALPDLNPSAYYFRAPPPGYDYLTPDGLVVNLYQEHFGKNLIEAVANQELFDYYRENGKDPEQGFKNFLLSFGYSTDFVNRAWEMAVIARDNGAEDPRVIEYLNSLTPKQKNHVLLVYGTLMAPFNLIETLASKSDDGKKVYVLVINKHYKDSKTVTINLKNFAGPSASIKADINLLTSGSVLDQNTPSEPRKVKVQTSSKTFTGDSFLYDAPSHSVTFIEFYR